MGRNVPLLELFPGCEAIREICGGLDKAVVSSVLVNRAELSMTADIDFPSAPSPADLLILKKQREDDYSLSSAMINAKWAAAPAAAETVPDGDNRKDKKQPIHDPPPRSYRPRRRAFSS